MKQGIHPGYKECKVTCACGNTFMTKSTEEEIRTDICSACHPFFTGQQKFTQRGGRVEKFKNKYGLSDIQGNTKQKLLREQRGGFFRACDRRLRASICGDVTVYAV